VQRVAPAGRKSSKSASE